MSPIRSITPILAAASIAAASLLGGCMHIPLPWSSDKAAKVERAQEKVDQARDVVLRRAQSETAVAEIALRSAPASRPVEIARAATATASNLQAQALGPFSLAGWQQLEKTVADLQSENVAIREAAERSRAEDAQSAAREAAKLAAANAKVDDLNTKLAEAYRREKELGDLVRKVVWICIGLGVLFVIASGLALYAKMALGGVGAALHAAGAPAQVIGAIDGEIAKFGQWMIASGRKAAAKIEALRSIQSTPSTQSTS